ncbi:hypothetical protein XBKQ1_2380041 [Xenorhabdus bovienii str. kraussei Quebec]|uniref:Uncharacterized protein n=1 Tax=Xenorhabdus bovienii str. kraussei Quebec TaxID=1398203 RepID=A0A077PH52_XENBV|nr:hypothetical protein XBKQ1_2380041 [Xenorhabdus bovienii str. kraussei Quebec]
MRYMQYCLHNHIPVLAFKTSPILMDIYFQYQNIFLKKEATKKSLC